MAERVATEAQEKTTGKVSRWSSVAASAKSRSDGDIFHGDAADNAPRRSNRRWVDIHRTGGSFRRGFASVLGQGMQHIAGDWDHLLFLFVLLLPTPLLASGKQ